MISRFKTLCHFASTDLVSRRDITLAKGHAPIHTNCIMTKDKLFLLFFIPLNKGELKGDLYLVYLCTRLLKKTVSINYTS